MRLLEKLKNMLQRVPKALFLFLVGGFAYCGIELLFRGYTYGSMFVLGGLCFLLIGNINEVFPWDMPLVSQMLISAIIITALEFLFGVVLNIILKIGVWDYHSMPYNLCGQICLIFSVAWFFLSAVGIILDDVLRWKIYGEEKPIYYIFYSGDHDLPERFKK